MGSPACAQIDIPINLRTGDPYIEIPLSSVTDKDLSVPLSLFYNKASVRVSETGKEAEDYGIGWRLLGQGEIVREVRDLPDDYKSTQRKGWLIGTTGQDIANYAITADNSTATCTDETTNWTAFYSGTFAYTDTEPDEFSFSIPGLSGKFFFDSNKQIRMVPYLDVKIIPYFINPQEFSGLIKFEIITNTGTRYTFENSDADKTVKYIQTVATSGSPVVVYRRQYNTYMKEGTIAINYKSTWHLSKITSPLGGLIEFGYTTPVTKYYAVPVEVINETNVATTLNEVRLEIEERELKVVRAESNAASISKSKIVFSEKLGREVRSFLIDIQNINNALGSPQTRSFLRSVQESTGCYRYPPFYFDYEGVNWAAKQNNLPVFESKSQDYWGYFNNQPNSTLAPTIYVYNSGNGPEKYRINMLPGVSPNTTLSGGNRQVNDQVISRGALTKVTFPPGGSATLEYEPKEYLDTYANVSYKGGGVRVKKVSIYDGLSHDNDILTEYEYKLSNGQSSGAFTYPPVFTFGSHQNITYRVKDNLSQDQEIGYSCVSVREPGKGKIVYEYKMPGVYPATSYIEQSGSIFNWDVTQVRLLRGSCINPGLIQTGNYAYPFPPNREYDFVRGLLSLKSEYNELGAQVKTTSYDYQIISPTPIEIRAFKVESYDYMVVLGEYKLITNTGKVTMTEREKIFDPSGQTTPIETVKSYYYDTPTHPLLSRTSMLNSDGAVYQTRYKYAKDYAGISTAADEYTAGLKALNENNMHGLPVETFSTITKDGASGVVSATLTKYKTYETSFPLPSVTKNLAYSVSFMESSLQTINGAQKFSEDEQYITSEEFLNYSNGKPLTTTNGKGRLFSHHWGYEDRLAVAEFNNATPDQVVFSGFETITGHEFKLNGTVSYGEGYTGKKALIMPTGVDLNQIVTQSANKVFRFTARVKSSTSGNVLVKIYKVKTVGIHPFIVPDGAYMMLLTLPFSAANQWDLIEGQVGTSGITGTSFWIEVTTSTSVAMDDVSFYPSTSSLTSYTYDPAFGRTSISTSNGLCEIVEYDFMGRPSVYRDHKRNITRKVDYKFQGDPSTAPYSDFSYTKTPYPQESRLFANDQLVITGGETCIQPVSHQWLIDGVPVSTAASFSHVFSSPGNYEVKHIVTHAVFGSSETVKSLKVEQRTIMPKLTLVSLAQPQIDACSPDYKETFRVDFPGYAPEDLTFIWERFSQGTWIQILPGASYAVDFCQPFDFTIRCKVSGFGVTGITNAITVTYNTSNCSIDPAKCN